MKLALFDIGPLIAMAVPNKTGALDPELHAPLEKCVVRQS